MEIKERSNSQYTAPGGWLATGLWIGAFGILLQAATGAKGALALIAGVATAVVRLLRWNRNRSVPQS